MSTLTLDHLSENQRQALRGPICGPAEGGRPAAAPPISPRPADPKLRQDGEAVRVCTPVGRGSRGDTAVVVQPDLLKVAEPFAAELRSYAGRQSAQLHSEGYVVDRLQGGHAQGFVVPVQHNVTEAGHGLEAIRQEQPSHFTSS